MHAAEFYPVCKPRGNWKMSLEKEDVILWNLKCFVKKNFGIILGQQLSLPFT